VSRSEPPPTAEIRVLTGLTIEAVELAERGCVGEGYTSLLEGLCRVRRMVERGETAAADLVPLYQQALDAYAGRYNMARD